MTLLSRALPLAICVLLAVPALAQQKNNSPAQTDAPSGPPPRERPGPTTSGDVLTQSVVPAPENGNIIVRYGETTQIYFKRAIKTIRLDDDLLVRAVPKSDHVIAFTGISPGRSSVIVETTDGSSQNFGLVTVVRDPHVVKIYQGREINRVTGERRQDSVSSIGGYVMLSCNEIGCTELEPELQLKAPK